MATESGIYACLDVFPNSERDGGVYRLDEVMKELETELGIDTAMKRSGWTVRGWVETDLTIGALRRGLAYKGKGKGGKGK
jgi:hypothetical protein